MPLSSPRSPEPPDPPPPLNLDSSAPSYVSQRGRAVKPSQRFSESEYDLSWKRPDKAMSTRDYIKGLVQGTVPEPLDPLPASYPESLRSRDADRWRDARHKHLYLLQDLRVFKIVDLPKGRKAIRCGWVPKVKRDEFGRAVSFDYRLVGRGYLQVFGLDWFTSFAPVCRYASIRMLLALACALDLDLYHCDVTSAYNRSHLNEAVYVVPPEGCLPEMLGKPGQVWQLLKALPGLKQSAAAWHALLKKTLLSLGFRRLDTDRSTFVRHTATEFVLICDWVDDLGIGCSKGFDAEAFFQQLNQHFPIRAGPMKHFLGMRITRSRADRTLLVDQEQHILSLMKTHSIPDVHYSTPMAADLVLTCPVEEATVLKTGKCKTEMARNRSQGNGNPWLVKYRQVLGSLLYLANTSRPDITYSTSYLSRFAKCVGEEHWNAAVRVCQYLHSTRHLGLRFAAPPSGPSRRLQTSPPPPARNWLEIAAREAGVELLGYADATWARLGSDPKSRSTSGYCFFLGGPVSWKSKVQARPALSSTDSELLSATEAARDAIWLRNFLEELGLRLAAPTRLLEDNRGAEEVIRHGRVKDAQRHMLLREHFVLWAQEDGHISIERVATDAQLADIFTKPLAPVPFERFRAHFMSG